MNIMRLKITFLVAVVVALFGVSAASASASTFLAAEYPVLVKGVSLNIQGFQAAGAVSVCQKGLFMTGIEDGTDPAAPSETLLIHPAYEECEISIAAKFKANVITTGCNYVFHALAPSTKHAAVDIECLTGKAIKIEVPELTGCTISVPAQSGLKAIEYVNEPGGKVKVAAEAGSIHWEATSGCGIGLSGTSGEYRQGEIVAGVAKLSPAGKPALADAEGIKEGFPDAIMVG
jgi:hypothetical protein